MRVDEVSQCLRFIESELAAGCRFDDHRLRFDATPNVFQWWQFKSDAAFAPGGEDELHAEPHRQHLTVMRTLDEFDQQLLARHIEQRLKPKPRFVARTEGASGGIA